MSDSLVTFLTASKKVQRILKDDHYLEIEQRISEYLKKLNSLLQLYVKHRPIGT